MPLPLAYFLTWTIHGSWLHGNPRGSVDARHRSRFKPRLAAHEPREQFERRLMGSSIQLLSAEMRRVIDETIRRHCEVRGWDLLALNVRTNHVHVVVNCGGSHSPEQTMEQFKAWSTRRLREAGLLGAEQRLWTEHGSTRWINDRDSLCAAIDYVMLEQ